LRSVRSARGGSRSRDHACTRSSACVIAPLGQPRATLADGAGWWSQSGSNRRPPACKAGALPAELWPRLVVTQGSFSRSGSRRARRLELQVVGLGGFEPPASPLSGVRSNQLSYRPGYALMQARGLERPVELCRAPTSFVVHPLRRTQQVICVGSRAVV
jgi:hypothetical protein